MQTTIYLIRHGEIDNPQGVLYGRSINLHLSTIGKQKIAQLGETLKKQKEKIEKIYTSPLTRAVQTSEILAQTIGLPDKETIFIETDLIDVDISALVGKPLSLRQEIHACGTDEYSEEFVKQGNESRKSVVDRMYGVFQNVLQENKNHCVAIVSHGDPLRFLIEKITHPDKEMPPMSKLTGTYIEKGEARKYIYDENMQIMEKQTIAVF